jgi:predicted DNA-binding transcriptional regulator YafY
MIYIVPLKMMERFVIHFLKPERSNNLFLGVKDVRLERLLAIIVKLLNRDRISAQELARDFEVTVRTIYRDIEAINLAGIPIISFQGQQGGFGIMENYRLDRQVLTLPEITSILSVLKSFQGTFNDRKLSLATDKIQNMVPKDKKSELYTHFEKIVFEVLPWGGNPKQKRNLTIVQEAVSEEKLLKFTYRNAKSEKKIRVIEPMTLVYKAYIWYLFGYCRLKKDYRIFRLTRMDKLIIQAESFIRRKRSYHEFFQKNDITTAKLIDLKLRFRQRVLHRVEDTFDNTRMLKQRDGSVVVHVKWPEDFGLYMFLLSFGQYVTVISPRQVQKELKRIVQEIAAQY